MAVTTRLEGMVFVTDALAGRRYDRVFPLFEDESLYFANRLRVRRDMRVLDIGTGSGILAIAAAAQGARVLATDVNPRALAFARKNAARNGVEEKITFARGPGLAPARHRAFDLVVMNPPFNPTPPGVEGSLFSDGGRDGLSLTRAVLRGAARHLAPEGRLQLITLSPGSAARPLVLDLVRAHLPAAGIAYTNLYPPTSSARFLGGIFGSTPFTRSFCRKFPRYFYLFLTVDTAKRGVREQPLGTAFANGRYAGNWEARIRRRRTVLGLE
ncbi:MAG: methyltransferase [Candidatus Aenigmarchaeota archaeon]|nr:methyltransferase [Candidatus Aenigmarchaeota archaeon]